MTISEEPEPRLAPDVIVEAVRGHFVYEGEQVERRLREHLRRGQMTLGVGLTVLVLFLTLAHLRWPRREPALARVDHPSACTPSSRVKTGLDVQPDDGDTKRKLVA